MKLFRDDFPIFKQKINEYPLAYLDSAATAQKPHQVLDAVHKFYTTCNANVGRSSHTLGEQATRLYEQAREKVAQFIGAQDVSEIIFTKGTTASINFVASAWAQQHLGQGDEIVLTELEHNSNILPWQRVAQQAGASLKYVPILPNGMLDLQNLSQVITPKTKLVAITHSSNAIGTEVDVATIIAHAHRVGAKVLIDAAQFVPHKRINVAQLGCEFLAFSGHKMLAPTGIGVLYIAKALHDELLPYQLGGGTVSDVDWHSHILAQAPQKFEAGTPPIAQAIGLGAAIDYITNQVDFDQLQKHEAGLCAQLINGLRSHDRITIYGPIEQIKERGHLVSFTIDGLHPHDAAAFLDSRGICVRASMHCAQPLAKKLGYSSSIRASFYLYNTVEEIDRLLQAIDLVMREL